MAGGKDEKEKLAPIVVKRIKKVSGGHHGGAWKVAYADFVTAMMAFFLLLWLLNVTTEDQKNAISNYFDPSHPRVSDVTSGAGGILGGMAMSVDGAMVSNVQPISQPNVPETTTRGSLTGNKSETGSETDEALAEEMRKREDKKFEEAAAQVKAEIAKTPELKDLLKNLMIDITPEGLRIQIVDDQGRSMFPSGSAQMYDFMRQLLVKVTGVVVPMKNQISVRGHTDSSRYRDPAAYDNWNLSADRAQASRRVMVQAGLPELRVENVMGRADREPLEADPASPRNRRISIILMREKPTKEALAQMKKDMAGEKAQAAAAQAAVQPTGLQIVDDTAPAAAPAGQAATPASPAPARAGTAATPAQPGVDTLLQQNVVPLPTIETPQTAPAPRVMVFGDEEAAAPANGALYEGPNQSPFAASAAPQAGPPQITTPAFDLPSSHTPGAAKPAAPRASVTFGDEAPAQAPAGTPAETGAPPSQSNKELQF